MTVRLTNDRDWLLQKAALEDNGCVSAGGLIVRLSLSDELLQMTELHGDIEE